MAEAAKKVVPAGTTQLVEGVESKIYVVRNHRVMMSTDLADLYGVETKMLLQAVRRGLIAFRLILLLSLRIKSLRS